MASTSTVRTPTAAHPLQAHPDFLVGTISQFRADKGFGFIDLRGDMRDLRIPSGRIFFHVKNLVPKTTNVGVVALFLHKTVRFSLGTNPRNGRLCAQNIHLENYTGPLPASPPSYPTSSPLTHIRPRQNAFSSSFDDLLMLNHLNFDDAQLEPILDMGHLQREARARGVLEELTRSQNEAKLLRRQAIDMGFTIPLVEQALNKTDIFGKPKNYTDFGQFLEELMEIQDAETAQSGSFSGAFDTGSDDFRFNAWMAQANDMGFPYDIVMEAMSATGSFDSFQDLVESVMQLMVDRENRENQPNVEKVKGPLVEASKAPGVSLAGLIRDNTALRDYFACKICMTHDAVVVFTPCGHLCCCVGCSSTQSSCPYCRRPLTGKLNRVRALMDRPVPPLVDDRPKATAAELQQENTLLQTLRVCIACGQRDRAAFLNQCGHIVHCLPCSMSQASCASCRSPIMTKTTVYFS